MTSVVCELCLQGAHACAVFVHAVGSKSGQVARSSRELLWRATMRVTSAAC